VNLCIKAADFPAEPVWSPDGQYLAVEVANKTSWWSAPDIVVVSLTERYAFKIAEGISLMGWLTKP